MDIKKLSIKRKISPEDKLKVKRLSKKDQIKAWFLLIPAVLGLGGCGNQKDQGDSSISYSIVQFDSTKDADISLFNIGNAEVKGESDLKDVKKANKKEIPCGIIISTLASTKGEIYDDVELAKYFLENADIKCPVYLNIDELLLNTSLRVDEMLALISTFTSKLTENRIMVGICGKEENLKILLENDKSNLLKQYDILIMNNNPELTVESNVSSMIKRKEDGSYITYEDFEKICERSGLNNPDEFLFDKVYRVKEGERIADIAYTYGLSVDDLLYYNNCTAEDLPQTLRIPTVYTSQKKDLLDIRKNVNSEYIMTLDISSWQEKINWDFIAEKYDFLILKITSHEDVATKFEENSGECSRRGIPFATYSCNYVSYINESGTLKSEAEMIEAQAKQVATTIKALQDINIQLPVFIDFENFEGNADYAENYTADQCCAMLDTWYDMLTKAGYNPGVYTNETLGRKLKEAYDSKHGKGSFEEKFVLWLAGDLIDNYGFSEKVDYDAVGKILDDHNGDIFDVSGFTPDVIQPWENGHGFGVDSGPVDVDFVNPDGKFFDGVVSEEDQDYDLPKTKIPDQKSETIHKLMESEAFGDLEHDLALITLSIFGGGAAGYFISDRKNKNGCQKFYKRKK